jgi:hypothetical protein
MHVKRQCPFCMGESPLAVSFCLHCGRDLQVMQLAHSQVQAKVALYQVVPDGLQFGIAIAGEVKIHGLDLRKAQDLAVLLNSVTEFPKAG